MVRSFASAFKTLVWTFVLLILVPSVAKKNEKTNLTEIKTKTKTKPKTKRVKLPTGGRFAPPSQVPPLLFSVSFSFSF